MDEGVVNNVALTAQEGHALQLLRPVLRDLDGLVLVAVSTYHHTLLVCVGHDLLQVLRVQGVEDVKKVFSRRTFVFRVLVGEVLREGSVSLQVRPQVLHRELVVVRHCDLLQLVLLQQLLPVCKDFLKEVLGDHLLLGKVVLFYKAVSDKKCCDLLCSSRYT